MFTLKVIFSHLLIEINVQDRNIISL